MAKLISQYPRRGDVPQLLLHDGGVCPQLAHDARLQRGDERGAGDAGGWWHGSFPAGAWLRALVDVFLRCREALRRYGVHALCELRRKIGLAFGEIIGELDHLSNHFC